MKKICENIFCDQDFNLSVNKTEKFRLTNKILIERPGGKLADFNNSLPKYIKMYVIENFENYKMDEKLILRKK